MGDSSDKTKVKLPVGTKVNTLFTVTAIVMCILNIVLLTNSSRYSSSYNQILDSISMANSISGVAKNMYSEMREVVNGKVSFEDGKQFAIIDTINNTVNALMDRTDNDGRTKLGVIQRTMQTLTEYVYKSGKQIKEDAPVDERERTLEDIADISEIVEENVQDFILYEINRSTILRDEVKKSFSRDLLISAVVLALVFTVSILCGRMISRNISNPIKKLQSSASAIAGGDLRIETLNVKTRDEIKELAEAFNAMKDSLREIISSVCEASGNLYAASKQMYQNALSNSASAEEISAASQKVAEGIAEQSGESKKSLESIESMFEAFKEIVGRSEEILENSEKSVQLAISGNLCIHDHMEQLKEVTSAICRTSEATKRLYLKVQEMSKILDTMDKISSQTNLLALNASIEAARAGQAGKGFAVVAEEIRKLAEESMVSAKRIGEIIGSVQQESDSINEKMADITAKVLSGNETADKARRYFELIVKTNSASNEDMKGISSELAVVERDMECIKNSMKHIGEIAVRSKDEGMAISAAVQKQTANLEELTSFASALSELAGTMEEKVKRFAL